MSRVPSRVRARAVQLLVTFLGITLVTFVLVRLAPGEPGLGGDVVSPESLRAWRELRGEGAPLVGQYLTWLVHLVRLDLGRSLVDERAVSTLLAEALPVTALLALVTLVLAYGFALPLGAWAATTRRKVWALGARALLLTAYSLPPFVLALTLLFVFAAGSPWTFLPLRGLGSPGLEGAGLVTRALDTAWHLALPAVALGLPLVARSARLLEASLKGVLGQDFVRAARARGLAPARVLWAHAVPAALVPLVATFSLDVPYLLGGSVVVERIFGLRGLGQLAFEAVLRRDAPVVLGVTVVAALSTLGAMVVGDLLHLAVDPRARRGGGS